MPAIERVIPLVGHLPASIREALARRLRELTGLGLIALSGVAAAALMTWSVQDPSLSPRHLARDPQCAGLSRRDRRRSVDADFGTRRDHADPAGRGVGLAHADPSRLRPRSAAARLLDPLHGDRGRLCQLFSAWRRLAAADRTRRRGRRCAGARARGRVRPGRFHLSPRARHHPVRRHDGRLPVRLRLGLAPARGRGADADRGRRRALRRGRGKPQLGFAGLDFPRHHEREGADRLVLRVPPIARWFPRSRRRAFLRAPGAQYRRPPRALAGAAGRSRGRRGRGRGRRGGRGARRPRAAQESRPAPAREKIFRQVRTAVAVGAHGAKGLGPATAQQGRARGQFARAGKRARRFRRPRRDRQGQSRARGDAVRTRAGAGHQIVARHRARRRHRTFDERAVGARRRGPRPQRDRHRAAERAS